MPDPIWVSTTPGVPNVADFASTGSLGTPVIINLATKVPYYLAPGNAVTAVATGTSGSTLIIDGGSATTTGPSSIIVDGGTA